jgi:hypothetical protein
MKLEDQVGNGFSLVEFVCFQLNQHGHGRDRMVVGFTTTYMQSVPITIKVVSSTRSWRRVFDTTLCDKVCQRFATGQLFSPVFSTNETDRHITEIMLKWR